MLNVGPTGRGEFDAKSLERLEGIGKWMRYNGRSIYGCTQAPDEFTVPRDCRFTYNPEKNIIYIHLFAWPFEQLHLYGFKNRIKYAQLLHDASEVKILNELPEWQTRHEGVDKELVTFELPIEKPDVAVPVIEVFLK
jgi:alpha-L-fucosidase